MVRFEGLVKRFAAEPVLRGATGELRAGEVWGVLGPNGAGKSTLLRILATLLAADAGRFEVAGQTRPVRIRAALSLVPHAPTHTPTLSVEENLAAHAALRGLDRHAAQPVIARFDLAPLAGRLGRELSRGQAQRVSLAIAELGDPPVRLLDEPFTGLDLAVADELSRYIRELAGRGRSVMLVSHDLPRAVAIADRLAVLHRGKLFEVPKSLWSGPGTPDGSSRLAARLMSLRSTADAGQVAIGHLP